MKQKKHGWILQEKFLFKGDCRFYLRGGGYAYEIHRAHICGSRQSARLAKLPDETIRKVSLTLKGKAKKIIERHGWVLKLKVEPRVLPDEYVRLLKDAWVISTRKEAREEKFAGEIIKKVKLNSEGIPIKIIGRG